MSLASQRLFLLHLSVVEKSQPPDVLVCTAVRFRSDDDATPLPPSVTVIPPEEHGEPRRVHLSATAEEIHAALNSHRTPPLKPIDERAALDIYPEDPTLPAVWAELHYDLSRTSYLEDQDPTVRFRSITIVGGDASIEVDYGVPPAQAVTLVPLSTGEFPVHAADEIGESMGWGG